MKSGLNFVIVFFSCFLLNTVAYAEVNLCKNMNYTIKPDVLGHSMKEIGDEQFIPQKKGVITYYRLLCKQDYFYDTPTGEEVPQESEVFWGFIKENGQEWVYNRILKFKVLDVATVVKNMSQTLQTSPEIQDENGKELTLEEITILEHGIYIWHTFQNSIAEQPENARPTKGVTTKLKFKKVGNRYEVKIAQSFDSFQPNSKDPLLTSMDEGN